MKRVVRALSGVVGLVAVAACSSDSEGASDAGVDASVDSGRNHDSAFPSCAAISYACHPFDNGDPSPANECHELAHDEDATEPGCFVATERCLAICGGDGGLPPEHDGGGH